LYGSRAPVQGTQATSDIESDSNGVKLQ
jgi:hypothetical protein